MTAEAWADFPGAEIIEEGLEDQRAGRTTVASLLVRIGSPLLRWLGVEAPDPGEDPEAELYRLLADEDPRSAHSKYNAWLRRLTSFEAALEHAIFRARRLQRGEQEP